MYLRSIGVRQLLTSVAHPRANGIVERYNRVIKEGFRRLLALCPHTNWVEHIPDILAGLRMLPTRLGVSPYMLCYK